MIIQIDVEEQSSNLDWKHLSRAVQSQNENSITNNAEWSSVRYRRDIHVLAPVEVILYRFSAEKRAVGEIGLLSVGISVAVRLC